MTKSMAEAKTKNKDGRLAQLWQNFILYYFNKYTRLVNNNSNFKRTEQNTLLHQLV